MNTAQAFPDEATPPNTMPNGAVDILPMGRGSRADGTELHNVPSDQHTETIMLGHVDETLDAIPPRPQAY